MSSPSGVRWASLLGPAVGLAAGFALGVLVQSQRGADTRVAVPGEGLPAGRTPDTDRPVMGLPDNANGRLSLFILAGQSNMSGRGDLPVSQETHPGVFVFGNDYRWKPAREPVDDPTGQVDLVSEDGEGDRAGFGPALSFALALADQRPDVGIGLIPCAKGDSAIHEWRRSASDSTLYGSCVKRVRAASLAGNVSGLLFFQGEADALTPERNTHRMLAVDDYGVRFSEVVAGLRMDLSMPALPVVFAQIGSQRAPLDFSNWERIRTQQRTVALTCSAMITTHDLPLRDNVHFTTPAYQAIGQRFATAYLELVAGSSCSP